MPPILSRLIKCSRNRYCFAVSDDERLALSGACGVFVTSASYERFALKNLLAHQENELGKAVLYLSLLPADQHTVELRNVHLDVNVRQTALCQATSTNRSLSHEFTATSSKSCYPLVLFDSGLDKLNLL